MSSTIKTEAIGNSLFINGDAVQVARSLIRDDSIDLIITDPPYGIEGDRLHQHYNRDESFVVPGYVEIPLGEYAEFSRAWIKEAERVLRPGGSLYVVSGYTHLSSILNALGETRLREINHIIWKYNFGVHTTRKYVSSHYHILYYEKPGARRTFNLESRYSVDDAAAEGGSSNYRDREDVWIINREYKPGQRKNKNELPSALLEKMMLYSSNAGDKVCDFFMGGFSTARVAIELGREFVGSEISATAFEHGLEMIRKIEPGSRLSNWAVNASRRPKNAGTPWAESDLTALSNSYRDLMARGVRKGDALDRLCVSFGRGKWAITKALKKMHPDLLEHERHNEPTLF